MIKAIETYYNGYRFRSQLEARWAVFFDAMGIRYLYEYEGFEHDFGDCVMRYLPDFYLPDYDLYAEVKGAEFLTDIPHQDAMKMSWFIDFDGPCANGIILLGNIPNPVGAITMSWAVWRWSGEGLDLGYICARDEPDIRDFYSFIQSSAPHFFTEDEHYRLTCSVICSDHELVHSKVENALLKARQARFEYGECG